MPTAARLARVPAFPSTAPQADLLTITPTKLEQQDESEGERLFLACCQYGFFRLDRRGSLGKA